MNRKKAFMDTTYYFQFLKNIKHFHTKLSASCTFKNNATHLINFNIYFSKYNCFQVNLLLSHSKILYMKNLFKLSCLYFQKHHLVAEQVIQQPLHVHYVIQEMLTELTNYLETYLFMRRFSNCKHSFIHIYILKKLKICSLLCPLDDRPLLKKNLLLSVKQQIVLM